MSKATTIKVGLAGAAALLMLSACASHDAVSSLDDRVAALESRLDAADSRVTQAEAAANQCTTTCQDVEARAERMIQQSTMK
jgi:F0F1-type ATP synthase membrane subunit b/b'